MCNETNHALIFVCSVIEAIGRQTKRKRSEVVTALGQAELQRLYDYADVLHSEPLEKVADDCIASNHMTAGDFDNVAAGQYQIPTVFDMAKVYARLICDIVNEAAGEAQWIDTLMEVYSSWIDAPLSDYSLPIYYQPRDYIRSCYQEGQII